VHELYSQYTDYEFTALVAFAILFEVWERFRPSRNLDRRAWIRRDLLAIAVAVAAINVSRISLFAIFERSHAEEWHLLDGLRALPGWVKVCIGIVFMDFTLYWLHRSMHRFDVLWRTHEWHHSPEALYWFSGLRTSCMHVLIYAIPQVLVPFFVLRLTALEAGIGFSFGVFIQFWAHSNIDVSLGPLDWIIISPAYHRIHHSYSKNRDKNLGTSFTIWDRLFGTFVDPRTVEPGFKVGLGYEKNLLRLMIGV
jgi:sterol desaturase/sphingolipid hydroxylase (fatty acid hydroxylase superfamily)